MELFAKIKTSLLAIALTSSLLLALAAGAHEKTPPAAMQGHDMAGMKMKGDSAGSMELHKVMMSGMKMPMSMSGDVDRDFAAMMIRHHQQAVKMADIEIAKGSNARLKALALKMRTAQQAEIKLLQAYTR